MTAPTKGRVERARRRLLDRIQQSRNQATTIQYSQGRTCLSALFTYHPIDISDFPFEYIATNRDLRNNDRFPQSI